MVDFVVDFFSNTAVMPDNGKKSSSVAARYALLMLAR